MSENHKLSAAEKLIELSKLCELLALEQSDTPEAHYAEAAAIVRELWPVRAKPLVWRNPHGPCVPQKSKQARKIVRISGGIGHGISCICDDGTAWRYVRKYTDDAIAYEGWEMLEPIPQGDCVISLAPRPMPEPPR